MPPEVHISSLVVQAVPAAAEAAARLIGGIPGAEVHGRGPTGKLVVTLETSDAAGVLLQIDAIRALPGVLLAELVYHQVEEAPAVQGGDQPCS
jgi:nitrate reductase NapD